MYLIPTRRLGCCTSLFSSFLLIAQKATIMITTTIKLIFYTFFSEIHIISHYFAACEFFPPDFTNGL